MGTIILIIVFLAIVLNVWLSLMNGCNHEPKSEPRPDEWEDWENEERQRKAEEEEEFLNRHN